MMWYIVGYFIGSSLVSLIWISRVPKFKNVNGELMYYGWSPLENRLFPADISYCVKYDNDYNYLYANETYFYTVNQLALTSLIFWWLIVLLFVVKKMAALTLDISSIPINLVTKQKLFRYTRRDSELFREMKKVLDNATEYNYELLMKEN